MQAPNPQLIELRQWMDQHFRWEPLTLDIQGHRVSTLRITNTDELMDRLIAKGPANEAVADEKIPYWADIWPSSLALAAAIMEDTDIQPQTQVLEIGCGLGLSGIAARQKGAEVLMTDYLPEPLEVLKWIWWQNFEEWPQTRQLDWRNPPPDTQARVILAADVVYEARAFTPLVAAYQQMLAPGGKILMAEPQRAFSQPFFSLLEKGGFDFRKYTREVTLLGNAYAIDLYEIWR